LSPSISIHVSFCYAEHNRGNKFFRRQKPYDSVMLHSVAVKNYHRGGVLNSEPPRPYRQRPRFYAQRNRIFRYEVYRAPVGIRNRIQLSARASARIEEIQQYRLILDPSHGHCHVAVVFPSYSIVHVPASGLLASHSTNGSRISRLKHSPLKSFDFQWHEKFHPEVILNGREVSLAGPILCVKSVSISDLVKLVTLKITLNKQLIAD
jgi:hypothetical protein